MTKRTETIGRKFSVRKKPVVKERKKTPSHGSTQVHVDKTKYNRKKKVDYDI